MYIGTSAQGHSVLFSMNLFAFSLNFTTAEGIFSYIAVIFTIMAVVVTLFSLLFGGDGHSDMGGDAGADHDAGSGMGMLSVRSVMGFFLGFGWGGLIAIEMGCDTFAASGTAVIVGGFMFLMIALIMRFIYSLRSDGTLNYDTLVNLPGVVYVTIPPDKKTGGQVRVAHPSQLLHLPAIQTGDTPLSAETPVIIVSVNAGILTVEPQ